MRYSAVFSRRTFFSFPNGRMTNLSSNTKFMKFTWWKKFYANYLKFNPHISSISWEFPLNHIQLSNKRWTMISKRGGKVVQLFPHNIDFSSSLLLFVELHDVLVHLQGLKAFWSLKKTSSSHALPQVNFLVCAKLCALHIVAISNYKLHDEVSHGMTWIAKAIHSHVFIESEWRRRSWRRENMRENMHKMMIRKNEKRKRKLKVERKIQFPYLDLWQELVENVIRCNLKIEKASPSTNSHVPFSCIRSISFQNNERGSWMNFEFSSCLHELFFIIIIFGLKWILDFPCQDLANSNSDMKNK